MYENLLKDVGLTENEVKVYLSLLKTGLSSTSTIVSDAKISGGKVYETLDKLHRKGLVAITEMNGVKHFQVTDPKALLSYVGEKKRSLEQQEDELGKILPQLFSLAQKHEDKPSVNLLIGERSIRPLMEGLFRNGKIICAMGVRGSKDRRYNDFWWHMTHGILEKGERKAKYLFCENESEYFKKHQTLKNVEARYILTVSPTAADIIDDNVLLFSYREELTCVHIRSKDIAESFRNFFLTLWEEAK